MSYFQWQILKIVILTPVFFLVANFWNKREFKNRFIKETIWILGFFIFVFILDSFLRLFIPRSTYEAMNEKIKPFYWGAIIIYILGWLGYHFFRLLRAIFYWVESMEKKHKKTEENE